MAQISGLILITLPWFCSGDIYQNIWCTNAIILDTPNLYTFYFLPLSLSTKFLFFSLNISFKMRLNSVFFKLKYSNLYAFWITYFLFRYKNVFKFVKIPCFFNHFKTYFKIRIKNVIDSVINPHLRRKN